MLPAEGLAFAAWEIAHATVQTGAPAAASQGSPSAGGGEGGTSTSSGGGAPREVAVVACAAFGAVAAARHAGLSFVLAICDEPLARGRHYFEVCAPGAALGGGTAPLRLLSASAAAATRALEAADCDPEVGKERRSHLADQVGCGQGPGNSCPALVPLPSHPTHPLPGQARCGSILVSLTGEMRYASDTAAASRALFGPAAASTVRVGVEVNLDASTLTSYVEGVATSKLLLGLRGPLYVAAACTAEAVTPAEVPPPPQALGLSGDLLVTLMRRAAPPSPPAPSSPSPSAGGVASAFVSCGRGDTAAGAAVHVLGSRPACSLERETLDAAWKESALAQRLALPPAQPPSLEDALGEPPSFSGVPFSAASPLYLLLPHVPSEGVSEAASTFATRTDVPRTVFGRPATFLVVKPWATPPSRMAMRLGVTEVVPAGAAAAAAEQERVALGFFECSPDFLDMDTNTVLGLRLVRADGFATALCLYSCHDVVGGGMPRQGPLIQGPQAASACSAPHACEPHAVAGSWELLGTQTVADNPAGLSWFVQLQVEPGAAHAHAALVHAIAPPERLPAPPVQPARATPAATPVRAAAAPLIPAIAMPPAAPRLLVATPPRRLGCWLAASLLEIVSARCVAWLALLPARHAAGARVPLGPQPSPGVIEACLQILKGAADGTRQWEELRLGALRVLDTCVRVLLGADAPIAAFAGAARALPAALHDGVWRALRDEHASSALRDAALNAMLAWMQLALQCRTVDPTFDSKPYLQHKLELLEPGRWDIVQKLSNISLIEGEEALTPLERLAATTLPERLAADWVSSADNNSRLKLQRLLEQAATDGGRQQRSLVVLLHAVQVQLLLAAASTEGTTDGAEVRRAAGRYAQLLLPLAARILNGKGGSGTLQGPFVSLLLVPWLEAAPELCEEVKVPMLQLLCQMHRVVQEMRCFDGGGGAAGDGSPGSAPGLLLRYQVHLQLGEASAMRTLQLPRAARFTLECVASEENTPGATPPVEGFLEVFALDTHTREPKEQQRDVATSKRVPLAGAAAWLVADGKPFTLVTPDHAPETLFSEDPQRLAVWPAHLALDGVGEALRLSWTPARKEGGASCAPRHIVVSATAPLPPPPPNAARAVGALRDALGAALMPLLASTLVAATLDPQGSSGDALGLRAVVRQLVAGSAVAEPAVDWRSMLELHRLLLARVSTTRFNPPACHLGRPLTWPLRARCARRTVWPTRLRFWPRSCRCYCSPSTAPTCAGGNRAPRRRPWLLSFRCVLWSRPTCRTWPPTLECSPR
jgi:hypothetical protein